MTKIIENAELNTVKKFLTELYPDQLTADYVQATMDRRNAENARSIAYNVALLKLKAGDTKMTDGMAKINAENDPAVITADAKIIEAEGREIKSRLMREDYFEKNSNIKKIAGLVEAEMKLV